MPKKAHARVLDMFKDCVMCLRIFLEFVGACALFADIQSCPVPGQVRKIQHMAQKTKRKVKL